MKIPTLYHGTSLNNFEKIKNAKEIQPRSRSKKETNWGDCPSHPDMVYLTRAYSTYYGWSTLEDEERYLVVCKVNLNEEDKQKLYPDEDYIAQVIQKQEDENGEVNLIELTKIVRDNIEIYQSSWLESLTHMGNCAYKGAIPTQNISRAIKMKANILQWSDPTITIINYQLLGGYYRFMTEWIFNQDLEFHSGSSYDRGIISKSSIERFLDSMKRVKDEYEIEEILF